MPRMRNATQYANRIKRLLGKIRGEAKKDPPVEVEDATQTLLLGILSRSATEKKAFDALTRLTEATVDLNDLRVTPVAEMVQIVGVGYPQVRSVCEETSQVLGSIFNRIHELDLSFLKSMGKKAAASFMDSLDGLSQHANAFFTLRYLETAAVALDEAAYDYLIKTGHLPERTGIEDAHKLLRIHVKESDAGTLSAALKVHARSSAGKKEMRAAAAADGADRKTGASRAASKKKRKTSKARAGTTKSRAKSRSTATRTSGRTKKKVTKRLRR